MKKNTWFAISALAAAILIAAPFEAEAAMDPKEAVELIENTFSNVLDIAEKEPELKKLTPKTEPLVPSKPENANLDDLPF